MELSDIIFVSNLIDETMPNFKLIKRLDKLPSYKKYKGLSPVCIKAAKSICQQVGNSKYLKVSPQKESITISYAILTGLIPLVWIDIDNEGEVALGYFVDGPGFKDLKLRPQSGWSRLVNACNLFNHIVEEISKNRVRLEREFLDAILETKNKKLRKDIPCQMNKH